MDLATVLDRLDIAASRDLIEPEWEESQATFPDGIPYFLEPDYVEHACEAVSIAQEFQPYLLRAAKRIATDEAARAYIWHVYWLMYEVGKDSEQARGRVMRLPRLVHSLGPDGGLLYALAAVAGLEQMQRIYRERGIPNETMLLTMTQMSWYMRETFDKQGFPEVIPNYAGWQMNHFHGKLFRLARLQFQFASSRYKLRVFRNDTTGQVLALSEAGVMYRPDGQILREGDDPGGSWTAELTIGDDLIEGTPILPQGYALHKTVRLPAAQWRQALAPGDPVLEIHIPGGEPMYYDECGEAFEQAMEFFPRYYPEIQFHAFSCHSWILDTALQQLLPEDSNLVRFQKEVYLFPGALGDHVLPHCIFGEVPKDLATAPRDTSLRRAYLDGMASGGVVTAAGGCFLLPEDLDWGGQVYVRQELPVS